MPLGQRTLDCRDRNAFSPVIAGCGKGGLQQAGGQTHYSLMLNNFPSQPELGQVVQWVHHSMTMNVERIVRDRGPLKAPKIWLTVNLTPEEVKLINNAPYLPMGNCGDGKVHSVVITKMKQLPLPAEGGTQAKSPGGWQAGNWQQATQVKPSERGAEPLAPERRPEGHTLAPLQGVLGCTSGQGARGCP